MIAIADTMVSITIAMGYPKGGTNACAAQGFLIYFFSRLSWFFTDVLIIQLFCVTIFRYYHYYNYHYHYYDYHYYHHHYHYLDHIYGK